MGFGWGMDAIAWLWMLVWILALLSLVWLIVRPDRHRSLDDPQAILRARFARGEISAEEFEQAQQLLAATGTPR